MNNINFAEEASSIEFVLHGAKKPNPILESRLQLFFDQNQGKSKDDLSTDPKVISEARSLAFVLTGLEEENTVAVLKSRLLGLFPTSKRES